ncbi:MAG: fibrobacter succinogenes major paralogous domain-containing protein [Sphaerochaetaceae bacterium]
MKQKQRIALLGIAAFALIFAACGGDSGNNGTEVEGGSSSSGEEALSSSFSISGSSAKVQSNSSVALCTNTYGANIVTDCRDGQTYRTVVIGTQTWMAENLNYAVDSSWCYENSADSCAKYGRLYQWASAMGLSATYNSTSASAVISAPQQGVCPTGWHIPTDAEWTMLEFAVGDSSVAGTKLKSTSGWDHDGNGTDAYGFSALPAGSRYYLGDFYFVGYSADFWSATGIAPGIAFSRTLYHNAEMYLSHGNETYAFSVRCVQDF